MRARWIIPAVAGLLAHVTGAPLAAREGRRLPATASAERSAPGYAPEQAVDGNETTLWVASLQPGAANNHVWFQLDLGAVRRVARLHWLAAQGTPYPASAPTEYRVLLSRDGTRWIPVPTPPVEGAGEPVGNVLLNADARYVRLETTRINDGTGWALGLKEIWVTEGRDRQEAALAFRPRITAEDGAVTLEWSLPGGMKAAFLRIYCTDTPTARAARPLATLPGTARQYRDRVPNWSPRYYRLEAVDSRGKALMTSDLAAAVARPGARAERRVETFAFWYEPYRPTTDPHPSLADIGDASFVVGPGPDAAADLAKAGKGLLPYVTYYQTAGWTEAFRSDSDPKEVADRIAPIAFYRSSLRFPGSPPGYAPTVFCRPGNVEYHPRSIFYTTCPNSAPFRQQVLAQARAQLDGGARGFFVDNGYEDDVAAASRCESRAHAHFYGEELTAADAFLGLVLEVSCAVKRRHPDGIVMVNGGVPGRSRFYGLGLGDVCDGQLWESYLRSSYSTPKEHADDWGSVYRRSVALEKAWQATPPQRMFVLSYPWDRDEAFFCYATAKLCDLPWSACLGVDDPHHTHFGGHFGTYPELIGLRLGPPVQPAQYGGRRLGGVYVREYERGLVAVNSAKTAQSAVLPLGRSRRYRDVFAREDGEGTALNLRLPPESGRVYLWRP